jgi:hypothetical protein
MKTLHAAQSLLFLKQAAGLQRNISPKEEDEIRRAKRTVLRGPFAGPNDPALKRLASPGARALLAGLTTAAAGASYGGLLGYATDDSLAGATIGGLGLGLPVALMQYLASKTDNKYYEDAIRRLPRGASIAEFENDPTIRRRLLRGAAGASGY